MTREPDCKHLKGNRACVECLRAEVERLQAAIAYVRMQSQHACEILNEFDNTRAALEPKP